MSDPVIIGIGGPVGAGKTQLVERLTRALIGELSMAAITNDIYTIEDAKILARNGVLPEDRIVGVETGGCPHTAIREDTSMNTAAIEELKERHPDLELIFVESGGDNLSATPARLIEASSRIAVCGQPPVSMPRMRSAGNDPARTRNSASSLV